MRAVISIHCLLKTPTDRSRKVSTLWADVIGVASPLSSRLVTFYSTSEWRRQRDTERPSGKISCATAHFLLILLEGTPYEHLPRGGPPSEPLLETASIDVDSLVSFGRSSILEPYVAVLCTLPSASRAYVV